jgi:hypothetical protein
LAATRYIPCGGNPWQISIPVIAIVIVAIAAYSTWKILQAKSGELLADERTKRIQGKAALATMMLVFYYLIYLNVYNIINIEFLGCIKL